MVEIQDIYCPVCESDYGLAFEPDKERLVVVCECDEAQTLDSFIKGFEEEFVEDEKGGQSARGMFQ